MSGASVVHFIGSTVAGGGAVLVAVSAANPLPTTGGGGGGGGNVQGTQPSGVIATANPIIVAGIDGTGTIRDFLTDASGILQVNASLAAGASVVATQPTAANLNATVTQGPGNVADPWTVGGPVASGGAIGGNPVAIGGDFNTTNPIVTTGQRAVIQLTSRGQVQVGLYSGATQIVGQTPGDAQAASTGLSTTSQNQKFNGSTWDRDYKPRTASRLPSSAASNNATVAKASPGSVLGPICFAVTSDLAGAYLKFFDGTTAPNPAVATPLFMIPLAQATTITGLGLGVFNVLMPAGGWYFPTGITWAITANPADLDNTAIAAGQIVSLNIPYQ